MAKYDPLEMHLLCLPKDQKEITLSFTQVEDIIEDNLPKSAYQAEWWSNEKKGTHVSARAWIDVGWKVESVNRVAHWVRFVRQ